MCSVRYVNFSFRKVRKIGSGWIKPYVHFNSGVRVVGAWHGAPTDLCKTAQIQQFFGRSLPIQFTLFCEPLWIFKSIFCNA